MQAVKTGVWAIVFILVLVSPSSRQNSIGTSTQGLSIALGGLIQAIVTLSVLLSSPLSPYII